MELSHPSFITTSKHERTRVLSDQEWKEYVRTQLSRQGLFSLAWPETSRVATSTPSTTVTDTVSSIHEGYDEYESIEIPSYFHQFSKERVQREILYYKTHNGRWSEHAVLEIFFNAMGVKSSSSLKSSSSSHSKKNTPHVDKHWFDENVDVCEWYGITCGIPPSDEQRNLNQKTHENNILSTSITQIHLPNAHLKGTIPSELSHLQYLYRLNLKGNHIYGSIPTELSKLRNLQRLDLGNNEITGTVPSNFFVELVYLEELWLNSNQLIGTIPEQLFGMGLGDPSSITPSPVTFLSLVTLDLSWNMFVGTISPHLPNLCDISGIQTLYLEGNMLSGTIPTTVGNCKSLRQLDLNSNEIHGTLPTELGQLHDLDLLLLSNNRIDGTFPTQILRLSNLQTLILSNNRFSGTLPQYSWRGMVNLRNLVLSNNGFRGSLPTTLGGLPDIQYLDLHENSLIGPIPREIGKFRDLMILDLSSNRLSGTLPEEIAFVEMMMKINITNNRLTGTIPAKLCDNILINDGDTDYFECEAIACPPGTYSVSGAASPSHGCYLCPNNDSDSNDVDDEFKYVIGRTNCSTTPSPTSSKTSPSPEKNENAKGNLTSPTVYPEGDVDGDGKVSQREILRLLYLFTSMDEDGSGWDDDPTSSWHKWKDLKTHECDLPGITCKHGDVVNIHLQNVDLCRQYDSHNDAHEAKCLGLPSELGLLHYLEVLNLSNSPGLRGSIPAHLGQLKHLRELHLTHSPNIAGTIPPELGNAVSLTTLNLTNAGLQGPIPSELGNLKHLEKLNLSSNSFSGSIPESFGKLLNIREVLISRSGLNGAIPDSIGNLSNLENLELYGNHLEGSLPESLGDCTFLMRLDVFNNQMTGTIPSFLTKTPLLQIAHLKGNSFTGTIPAGLGSHPLLSWLDVSSNRLRGKIPEKFGTSESLKDLRVGDNRLQGSIPESLCTNKNINGGRTHVHGCDAIVCPIGYYSSDAGYASNESPCQKCPNGETTLYLGSTECHAYTQRDYLKIFYDMMKGDQWENKFNKDWKEDGVSECDWAGVSCDADGLIDGLSFPIAASSWSAH